MGDSLRIDDDEISTLCKMHKYSSKYIRLHSNEIPLSNKFKRYSDRLVKRYIKRIKKNGFISEEDIEPRKKNLDAYKMDYQVLTNMLNFSIRLLTEVSEETGKKIPRSIYVKMHRLYNRYSRMLNEHCFCNTGKLLFIRNPK